MDYELADIRRLRKKTDLTQQQLAKMAGVSQSIVAKLESGLVDPSYSTVKKIMSVLEQQRQQQDTKIADVMNRHIISCKSSMLVKDAVILMKQKGVSQLPVIDDTTVTGLVSESIIMDALMSGIAGKHVADIMHEPPPIISLTSPIDTVVQLLKTHELVIVTTKGQIKGIISRTDLFDAYLSK